MGFRITRRDFTTRASSAFVSSWLLYNSGCTPIKKVSGTSDWIDLPPLDGTLSFEDVARSPMAVDLGNHYFRMPAAVLQPRSINDIIKVVRHANSHKLKVSMRGQGHSQYGQTLAEDGIVIDSRTFKVVKLVGSNMVDAQAGASWDDVTQTTLAKELTPPAMGDTMALSVGGILSAGGISNSSHLYGGVVDNVVELDVVTGNGELITCSARKNTDLFDVTLAGMGQCGLIVSARLRLVPSPKWAARCNFDYDNLKDFLYDYQRIAKGGKYEHLGAYALPRTPGEDWKFRINVGKFCSSPSDYNLSELESELKAISHDEPAITSFADYLHREKQRNEALKERLIKNPTHLLYCAFFLPESVSEEFISGILSSSAETDNMIRFSIYMLPSHKLSKPMFMLPREAHTVNIFLFHGVPVSDKQRYAFMTDNVKKLSDRVQASSGKMYPPYAPFFTRSDWTNHYGPEQWSKLAASKRKYDPNGILTPGMEAS